jgi:hypothetical protein
LVAAYVVAMAVLTIVSVLLASETAHDSGATDR